MIKIFWSTSRNPVDNLAAELFLLRDTDSESLLLYVNEPSLICGRLQIPYAEINFCRQKKENIPVFRRYSGGGTVFHDTGNLNFAFISNHNSKRNNYHFFNSKIVDILEIFGIPSLEIMNNNIFSSGQKISGTAQYKFKSRLLHHGTLLIDTDLKLMSGLLRQSKSYYSRSVRSVVSNVKNIGKFIKTSESVDNTISEIISAICEKLNKSISLETFRIHDSMLDKYKDELNSFDWIYSNSPEYRLVKGLRFRGVDYSLNFIVKKGIIYNTSISGDGILKGISFDSIRHYYDDLAAMIKTRFDFSNDENEYLTNNLF